ncbi:hypothetical protein BZA70DRAFT_272536 [Myxozyma melibiosi]|uniref:Uncharacterized protein n=1 Tax=Myxozyma melibiosi TaxID=54550 RepID=A0ABR1FDK1_9ASCO
MNAISSFRPLFRGAPAAARFFSASAARSDIAKMILVGRMGNTPDLRTTSADREYVRYSLAVRGSRNETSWYSILGFNSVEYVMDHIQKGDLVCVEADASLAQYEVNGQRNYRLQLVQRNISKLSSSRKNQQAEEEIVEEHDAEAVEEEEEERA